MTYDNKAMLSRLYVVRMKSNNVLGARSPDNSTDRDPGITYRQEEAIYAEKWQTEN